MQLPKYQIIANELRLHIEAGKYAHSTVLPTEFALTEEYGVSRQTIRQALLQLSRLGLIERRQGSGSHILRHQVSTTEKHHTIAVIITYIGDYIFPTILREIEDVLSANHCVPSLFATNNEVFAERRILKNLLEMDIDGILVDGTKSALPNPNLDLYRAFSKKNIPIVFLHSTYRDLENTTSVLDDNLVGGKQLVEYLYEKGHRVIGGMFKNDDIQGHQRFAGFTSAVSELGLPMEDSQLLWYSTEQKEAIFAGKLDQELDKLCEKITALVCYNDEVAGYITKYLITKGIKIPEKIAIVSFDNSRLSDLSPVPITSLSHEEYNVGRMGANLLVRQLNNQPAHSQIAPWTLMEKESS